MASLATERRKTDKGVRFDWTINMSNILTILLLIATIIRYGNDALYFLRDISTKTNIMWVYFVKTNPDAGDLLKAQER